MRGGQHAPDGGERRRCSRPPAPAGTGDASVGKDQAGAGMSAGPMHCRRSSFEISRSRCSLPGTQSAEYHAKYSNGNHPLRTGGHYVSPRPFARLRLCEPKLDPLLPRPPYHRPPFFLIHILASGLVRELRSYTRLLRSHPRLA